MSLSIVSSLKEVFKHPLGGLWVLLLLIPINLLSILSYNYSSSIYTYLSSSNNLFLGLAYLFKNALPTLAISLVLGVITIFASAVVLTLGLNYYNNKVNSESLSLFNGLSKMFWFNLFLYVGINGLMYLLYAISSIWAVILMFIIYILLFFVLLPRLFFVPMEIIKSDLKIGELIKNSWEKTESSYWSILFFVILFSLFYSIVGFYWGSSIFVYSITTTAWLVTLIEIIIQSLIDAFFIAWVIAVMISFYNK